MGFWTTSDNKTIEAAKEFELGSSMEPLPEGTKVLAAILECAWKEYEGSEYINIQWGVLAPEEHKNRRVFQKVRVYDDDSKKADNAKRMLAAIDANCGGKLMKHEQEVPDDHLLTTCLVGKPMVLRLGQWEIDGKKGNWVQQVAPRNTTATKPKEEPKPEPKEEIDFDSEIPF